MTQEEFLKEKVFTDLTNQNDGFTDASTHCFSETDFEILLERVAHFGIAIHQIEAWKNGSSFAIVNHEEYKRKATDAKWYIKAFNTQKYKEKELLYSAAYKVSKKLLAR